MTTGGWYESAECRELADRLGAILEQAEAGGRGQEAFALVMGAVVAGLAAIEPARERARFVAELVRDLPGQVERMAEMRRTLLAGAAGHG
ncbi:hypothetical protein [Benzoatithermus flavus]|uniref:Uncharacterized protein n=1 Tax=Benzoatithermus flavus TaxID=3108223 RepID=A0ABU8XNX2_9PROT